MPIIIDPNVPNPAPPERMTSPDGILTAYQVNDGILLVAQFGDPATPTSWPDKVRFTRRPNVLVRSGNDAWAVGGQAVAYDMEAPLGQSAVWHAIPIDHNGVAGDSSEGVGLANTKPTEPYNSWLKSIVQPELSMPVFFTNESLPSWSYAARNTLSQVQGSPYPAGGRDKHMAAEITLSAYTDPDVDQQQMLQLLTSGPLLFQTDPDYNEPDFYAIVGDLTRSLAGTMANGARKWEIPLTTIARPSPYGAPLWIPGRTLNDTQQGTLALRQQVFPLVGDTLRIPA